jgi:alginate O-acetyltransferase complex protein AlgF
MKNLFSRLLLVVLMLGAPVVAFAGGDDGLYDAPPSPDTAFIRILNAGPQATDFEMTIGGETVSVAAQSLGPYMAVQAGKIDLATPAGTTPATIEGSKYYTFAVTSELGKPSLYEDDGLKDPAKGRLYFYNLTKLDSVALYVPAAKKDALSAIQSASASSIELRAPLEVDMVARTTAGDIASFQAVTLKRRSGTSLVLSGGDGHYAGFAVANTVAK